jgi:hypothetical protein
MTMRARYGCYIALAAVCAALLAPGCADGTVDDGDTGDVILEVANTATTPITTAEDPDNPGSCSFVVTEWTSTLNNKPKNAKAIVSPWNDILMGTVDVTYAWDDPAIVTPPVTMNVSGTVPANGSLGVKFPPILLGDVTAAMEGHSANLVLTFHGTAVSGEAVTTTAYGAVMSVNSCIGS